MMNLQSRFLGIILFDGFPMFPSEFPPLMKAKGISHTSKAEAVLSPQRERQLVTCSTHFQPPRIHRGEKCRLPKALFRWRILRLQFSTHNEPQRRHFLPSLSQNSLSTYCLSDVRRANSDDEKKYHPSRYLPGAKEPPNQKLKALEAAGKSILLCKIVHLYGTVYIQVIASQSMLKILMLVALYLLQL
ncbi:hypothetical protein Nepgr_017302 [Nepenthes gracilis]|uniref:Uncharacterized protein n=1 Tax=Nepenthes gracilis TaxID=150966 RepID=A0AAD3SRS5_NEPGR|nr:hypothetical protein Nepgr_017302 [Nepenthes gracilis]